jgi:Leucine-rich repeat (LRR) protein
MSLNLKKLAALFYTSMDAEDLKNRYKLNPDDVELRKTYLQDCTRRNTPPTVYTAWVKKTYKIDIDLNAPIWDLDTKNLPDLNFLSGVTAPNLTKFFCRWNNFNSLDGLQGFNAPKLRVLDLSSNKVVYIKGLSGITAPRLIHLRLSNNSLFKVVGLKGVNLPSLVLMDLSYNKIQDLNGLGGFIAPKLKEIRAYNNEITDMDGLYKFNGPSLETVNLLFNKVKQFRLSDKVIPFRAPKLKNVRLESNNLINLKGLSQFNQDDENLTIDITRNPVSSHITPKHLTKYPFLKCTPMSFDELLK